MTSGARLTPGASHKIVLRDDKGSKVFDISLVAESLRRHRTKRRWPDIGAGVPEKGGPYAFRNRGKGA